MPHSSSMAAIPTEPAGAEVSGEVSPVLAALPMDDPGFRRRFRQVVKHLFSYAERLLITLHYADGLALDEVAILLDEPRDRILARHETVLTIVRMVLARADINFSADILGRAVAVIRGGQSPGRCSRRLGASRFDVVSVEAQLTSRVAWFRIARVLRDLNLCHADEAVFLIATPLLQLASDRIEEELDNPASTLAGLAAQMERLERDYQLPGNVFWTLEEAPQAYRDLNAQWEQQAEALTATVLREYGEDGLADLYAGDRAEFDRRYEAGRSRCGEGQSYWPHRLGLGLA